MILDPSPLVLFVVFSEYCTPEDTVLLSLLSLCGILKCDVPYPRLVLSYSLLV